MQFDCFTSAMELERDVVPSQPAAQNNLCISAQRKSVPNLDDIVRIRGAIECQNGIRPHSEILQMHDDSLARCARERLVVATVHV